MRVFDARSLLCFLKQITANSTAYTTVAWKKQFVKRSDDDDENEDEDIDFLIPTYFRSFCDLFFIFHWYVVIVIRGISYFPILH